MEAQILNEDPRENSRLFRMIVVCTLEALKAQAVEAAIAQVPVQNDVALWDCQDYVLDIMDSLAESGLVELDEDFTAIRKCLDTFRGPADETRHLVRDFDPERLHDDAPEYLVEEQQCETADDDESFQHRPKAILSAETVLDSDDDD